MNKIPIFILIRKLSEIDCILKNKEQTSRKSIAHLHSRCSFFLNFEKTPEETFWKIFLGNNFYEYTRLFCSMYSLKLAYHETRNISKIIKYYFITLKFFSWNIKF